MLLTRRQFFAMPAAAALVSALPRGILAAPPEPAISYSLAERAIKVREPMSFNVLHRLLMDHCDDAMFEDDLLDITCELPTSRITPDIYSFEGDWHFADDLSREMIRCSSWQEGGDVYSYILNVGQIMPDSKIHWQTDNEEGLIECGQALKIKPGSDLVFSTPRSTPYRAGHTQLGSIAVPHCAQIRLDDVPDSPSPVDARTLINGWRDASHVPEGLVVVPY